MPKISTSQTTQEFARLDQIEASYKAWMRAYSERCKSSPSVLRLYHLNLNDPVDFSFLPATPSGPLRPRCGLLRSTGYPLTQLLGRDALLAVGGLVRAARARLATACRTRPAGRPAACRLGRVPNCAELSQRDTHLSQSGQAYRAFRFSPIQRFFRSP